MLVRRHSARYNFAGDPETGTTARWGAVPGEDPRRAPWPELADISISNRCSRGCSFCYRDSRPDGPLMSLAEYDFVLDSLTSPRWGPVFQVALGGGEPTEHPDFVPILEHTRSRGVVANFTTSGAGVDAGLARRVAGLAGAVAVSAASLDALDMRAVRLLISAGARVNIHYVLGRASLAEATDILDGRADDLLAGVNAVIFLTLKAMGRAEKGDGLTDGPELARFLSLVSRGRRAVRIGFDACFVPPLLRHTGVNPTCVDPCEGGFFSVYVSEGLQARPCSFSTDVRYHADLRENDFGRVWNEVFAPYRDAAQNPPCARDCPAAKGCRGPCPDHPECAPCPVTEAPGGSEFRMA